jgi:predicted nucleic acid-binding protein
VSILLFADNTVLVNFALLGRMDLLESVLNGKGAWCNEVARECGLSAREPDLASLDEAARIFGNPHMPTPVERVDTIQIRTMMSKPGDARHAHLGEAETIAIISRRQIRVVFVTDDADAFAYASKQGIQVIGTWDLLRNAYGRQLIDLDAVDGYRLLLERSRRARPPGVRTRADLQAWLERRGR